MARTALVGPQNNAQPFNTGDSSELGQHPKEIVDSLNAMTLELYADDAAGAAAIAAGMGLKYTDVTIPTAQVLTLFTTPRTVLAAPGVGFANVLEGVILYKAAGTAYAGIAAGEDLSLNYTNAAGTALAGIETTGFLDQATAQTRWADGYNQASAISSFVPVENAAIVLGLLLGDITTGTSDLKLRLIYRTIPTVL
jgi:hypothetical protein